ncbi:MAG: amidase domain-containing protein [Oscillospiraceae bacterium]|nr:amidase domain-containing protein [Oscillospiraceae bacterium]
MSNRRRRRRFYPEFYTEDELKNIELGEQDNQEELELLDEIEESEELNELEGQIAETNEAGENNETEETMDTVKNEEIKINDDDKINDQNYNGFSENKNKNEIENLFDRTKKPETPMIRENLGEIKTETEKVGDTGELSIEIPQDMYIRDIPVYRNMDIDDTDNIDNTPELPELSLEENEEIHKIFDTVYNKTTEPEVLKLPEESIELEQPGEDLSLSIPVFEEYSNINPDLPPAENIIEPVAEPVIEKKPENLLVPEAPLPEVISNPGIIPFDRDKAIEYARRWVLDRNPDYYDFDDIGGDCTNYISQILLAGGCKMDTSSALYGWYYHNANDKSPSWTGVEQLYDYLIREKDYGIIAHEIDINEVEAGDIAQLSFNGKSFQHTPFIVSLKHNSDDSVSYDHIKICAHSFDSENRSIDTYQWKNIRFIRIVGFKEN